MAKQQDDTRYRQLTKCDSHQLGIEWWDEVDLEPTGDFPKNGDWFFSV